MKTVVVDVFADRDGENVVFDHEWRREGDPVPKKGRIDIGFGDPPTELRFQLHDRTARPGQPGLRLSFVEPAEQAMWVSLGNCPQQSGNGGQISFDSVNPQQLRVTDANAGDECILHYALRFNGDPAANGPPYVYDPDIRNGGGGGI